MNVSINGTFIGAEIEIEIEIEIDRYGLRREEQ